MLKLRVVKASSFNAARALGTSLLLLAGCVTAPPARNPRTQVRTFDHFEPFHRERAGDRVVMVSPRIEVRPWNELIVSWNASCPPGTALDIEARGIGANGPTRFYKLGSWSSEPGVGRTSLRHEGDDDASVDTDTLIARHVMNAAQVRVTLHGTNGGLPTLKLLTMAFLNASAVSVTNSPNRLAWGRTLDVPQRSQLGYPGGKGWCSPTALSMILAYWSGQLHRPELDLPVPEVARAVHDSAYRGTGNWAFNVAFAGSFEGMHASARRFEGLRQVEDCIAAGIPLALSVSFDLLNGREKDMNSGHLIVVVGFTPAGDVVVNDPWPNPKNENRVRKIFPRERLLRAWQRSKQTVYIVWPDGLRLPLNV